jgi:hypothetical protein
MPTYSSKATTLPAVNVTLTVAMAQAVISLFRNEADRLKTLDLPRHVPSQEGELLDVANDLDGTLNTMFPERRKFIEDHD